MTLVTIAIVSLTIASKYVVLHVTRGNQTKIKSNKVMRVERPDSNGKKSFLFICDEKKMSPRA